MPRTATGPLVEFAGKIIARKRCESCDAPVFVKVNKSGWPYAICPHNTGCGYHEKAQTLTAARRVLRGAEYAKGMRRAVEAALADKPKTEAPADLSPEDRRADEREAVGMFWE